MANEEHVEILKQGAEVWNQWRKDNKDVKPDLSGAYFFNAYLNEADLSKVDLSKADLSMAYLNGADLSGANLSMANLHVAKLTRANLYGADLSGANLSMANLSIAFLWKANLSRANLEQTNLSAANLDRTNLSAANLDRTNLQNAYFDEAIVDGRTLLVNCEVDRKTSFAMVGLGDMRIDSGTRQLLEYNIRRKQWKEWCYPSPWWKTVLMFPFGVLTHLFWLMSDYGKSTLRIIISFFALALIFAVLYWQFDGWLIVDGADGITDFLHACYFSIVTMTTLGFGDIHASPNSHCGQIVLMGQVLLGYIMLGALVTRFAVLFTAGGPAAKFTKMDKMTKAKLKEIKKR